MSEEYKRPTQAGPEDDATLTAALFKMLRDRLMTLDGCLPVFVVSYDRAKNIATVKPAVNRTTMAGDSVERPEIVDLPVLALGAAGYVLNYPIRKGDKGWIVACDRDISRYLREFKLASPDTDRLHEFGDSWFVPDVIRDFVIRSEHEDDAVFQSLNGETRVAVGRNRVTIGVGNTTVILTNGKVEIKTQGLLDVISSESKFSGNVSIAGALEVKGKSTLTGGASSKGKEIDGHVHGGVQRGGSNTDGF